MSVAFFHDNKWVQLPINNAILVGSIDVTTKTASSSFTLGDDDYVVFCDAKDANITVTLPVSTSIGGRMYHIKKIDSSGHVVTVDGNSSEKIDGGLTARITRQYGSIKIVTDGARWYVL